MRAGSVPHKLEIFSEFSVELYSSHSQAICSQFDWTIIIISLNLIEAFYHLFRYKRDEKSQRQISSNSKCTLWDSIEFADQEWQEINWNHTPYWLDHNHATYASMNVFIVLECALNAVDSFGPFIMLCVRNKMLTPNFSICGWVYFLNISQSKSFIGKALRTAFVHLSFYVMCVELTHEKKSNRKSLRWIESLFNFVASIRWFNYSLH